MCRIEDHNFLITPAGVKDAEQIADLLNSAYRGESSKQGWTTEADLLDGKRTDIEEISQLILDENSIFLLCKFPTELVGVVNLQQHQDHVLLGMLAVSPPLQGHGIGKKLLAVAELTSKTTWGIDKLKMSVISCRKELIAFYERRGYRRTGISRPFPKNSNLWIAKIDNLQLEILEKPI